jgi:hypothetical protein
MEKGAERTITINYINKLLLQPNVMEDFDYIGTGGFILECQNDEVLGVTKEQADKVCTSCPFFDKCLNGGMLESQSRTITKLDWNLAIARHIIQLLTTTRTTLPSLDLYEEFLIQSDALCLDARLCNFVNYMDTTHTKDTRFLELAREQNYFRFSLIANVRCEQWLLLLDQGILLNREKTNYVVQLHHPNIPTEWTSEQIVSRRNLDSRISNYQVYAEMSIHALMSIQQLLAETESSHTSGSRTNRMSSSILPPLEEQYTIYFEAESPLAQDHHDLIDRLAGGQAYTRTCADAAAFQTEGYTVQASPDVLRRTLDPLSHDESIVCSLRIDHPSPDTIGRMINASQQPQIDDRYKGTIGLDIQLNRYFCRKPLADILAMLEYLVDFSTTARIQEPFTVYLLSSEDKVF